MTVRRTLAPALAAALLAAGPAGAAEPVEALVRRCVDAYGGRAAVARAAVVLERGRTTSLLHPGATGGIVRAYQRPGRLRVEITFPGAPPEVRVLDGGRGSRFGQPASGAQLASMILQAARIDLPATLQAFHDRVRDRGTWVHEGRTLRVLAIEVAPGLEVEAGVDPASGRILRSRGVGRDASFPLEFVTTYSDFRKVEGVLYAFREGNWANGATTGETRLESIELEPALPDETFRP
jgi:hypothetical protein